MFELMQDFVLAAIAFCSRFFIQRKKFGITAAARGVKKALLGVDSGRASGSIE
jgi:hypothetical protein